MFSAKSTSLGDRSTAAKRSIRSQEVSAIIEEKRQAFMLTGNPYGWNGTPENTLNEYIGQIEKCQNQFADLDARNFALKKLVEMFERFGKGYLKEFKELVPQMIKKSKILYILKDWLSRIGLRQSKLIIDAISALVYFCPSSHHASFFEARLHDSLLLLLFENRYSYGGCPVAESFDLLTCLYTDNGDQIEAMKQEDSSKIVDLLLEYSNDQNLKSGCIKFFSALCSQPTENLLKGISEKWIDLLIAEFMSPGECEDKMDLLVILVSITDASIGHEVERRTLTEKLISAGFFQALVSELGKPQIGGSHMKEYMLCCLNSALCFKNSQAIDSHMTQMPSLIEVVCSNLLTSIDIIELELTLTLIKNFLQSTAPSELPRLAANNQVWRRIVELLTKPTSLRKPSLEMLAMKIVCLAIQALEDGDLLKFTGIDSGELADLLLCYVERSMQVCPKACNSSLAAVVCLLDRNKEAEAESPPLQVAYYKYSDMLDDLIADEDNKLPDCRELARQIVEDYVMLHPFKY